MEKERLKYLFDKYYPRLVYFAEAILKNREEAKDVVANVFAAITQEKVDYINDDSIRTWLYLSTKNACLNILRKRKSIQDHRNHVRYTEEEGDRSWELQFIDSQVIAKIYEQIGKLPRVCKKVFIMYYLEGFKTGEIAAALNMKLNNVSMQKARAIKLLKLALKIEDNKDSGNGGNKRNNGINLLFNILIGEAIPVKNSYGLDPVEVIIHLG